MTKNSIEQEIINILANEADKMCKCTAPFFIVDKTVNHDQIKQVAEKIISLLINEKIMGEESSERLS